MNNLHSIDKESQRYVISAGGGFSCWGFGVINNKAEILRGWLKSKGQDISRFSIPGRSGTKKHFTACDAIICAARDYAVRTQTPCHAFLVPELVGLEGQRVEVRDAYGDRRRFTVGRSTGWMPAHTELHNKYSRGGLAVSGLPFSSVTVITK